MRFTTGTSATDPGAQYDREPAPVGDTIRGIMADLSATHGCIHTGRWQCCADVAPCPCKCDGCVITLTSPDVPEIDPGIREISVSLGLSTAHYTVQGELSRDSYPPARRRTP